MSCLGPITTSPALFINVPQKKYATKKSENVFFSGFLWRRNSFFQKPWFDFFCQFLFRNCRTVPVWHGRHFGNILSLRQSCWIIFHLNVKYLFFSNQIVLFYFFGLRRLAPKKVSLTSGWWRLVFFEPVVMVECLAGLPHESWSWVRVLQNGSNGNSALENVRSSPSCNLGHCEAWSTEVLGWLGIWWTGLNGEFLFGKFALRTNAMAPFLLPPILSSCEAAIVYQM